jgi:hypothetical protein
MCRIMDNGNEMKKRQEELGLSILEVALAAELTPQTVYRVYKDGASRKSTNLVRRALTELKASRYVKSKSAS